MAFFEKVRVIFLKKLFYVLACALLCFAFAFNSFAAQGTMSVKAFQHENSNIEVKVTMVTENSGLYTTEFFITYDNQSIEYIDGSYSLHDDVKELSPYLTVTETEKGRVKVSYTSTKPLEKAATICKMSFKPKKDTLTSIGLEIEHAETFDGENFPTLDIQAKGTTVHSTKIPFWAGINVAAAGVCAVLIIGIVVVLILRYKNKASNGK